LCLVNIIQAQEYTANANCHGSNYTEVSERMHMYIWEMACDSSCLSVDCFPSIPLWPVNQHEVCAASKVYHAVNITNIYVNRMARQLEGNIWKYIVCLKVNCDRSREVWRALSIALLFLATVTTILPYVVYRN